MAVTQAQVDELLAKLQALLKQFALLRWRVDELREGAEIARRDYDQYLEVVNNKADELEGRRDYLKSLLNDNRQDPQPPGTGGANGGTSTTTAEGPTSPMPPLEDPRAARKRALADHILYFMDSAAIDEKQVINAILVNDMQDVGHMLEALAWGPIWSARPAWETLDDQLARLEGWRDALKERQAFWEREVHRIETGQGGALYRRMISGSREEWIEYLNGLVADQQTANEQFAGEVSVLEEAWVKKQAQRVP